MESDLWRNILDYVPILIIIIGFGKMVESLFKMSKTAEHTLYLIKKVDAIERSLRNIDSKLNK